MQTETEGFQWSYYFECGSLLISVFYSGSPLHFRRNPFPGLDLVTEKLPLLFRERHPPFLEGIDPRFSDVVTDRYEVGQGDLWFWWLDGHAFGPLGELTAVTLVEWFAIVKHAHELLRQLALVAKLLWIIGIIGVLYSIAHLMLPSLAQEYPAAAWLVNVNKTVKSLVSSHL